jgi:hypothetical protein
MRGIFIYLEIYDLAEHIPAEKNVSSGEVVVMGIMVK